MQNIILYIYFLFYIFTLNSQFKSKVYDYTLPDFSQLKQLFQILLKRPELRKFLLCIYVELFPLKND